VAEGLVFGAVLAACSPSAPSPSGGDASAESSTMDDGPESDASTEDATASGDDAGTEGDSAGAMCDGGTDAGASPCRFSPATDGGLASFVTGASNCTGGGGTGAFIQFAGSDRSGPANVTFRLATSITIGQTGVFQASLEVDESPGGAPRSWSTPGNDCTLLISSNECAPTSLDPNQTLITGSGLCSKPAQSMPSGGTPIDLGSFTFTGLIQ
jgi:hypothetical protein